MSISPLIEAAVSHVGSQSELARQVGVTPQAVYAWLQGGSISPVKAAAVERATHGAITREDLRPDIFRRDQPATPTTTPVHSAIPDSSICPRGHSE